MRDSYPRSMADFEMSVDARSTFITKTYLHLFGAIVAFMALEAVLLQTPAVRNLAQKMTGGMMWLGVLGAFMVVSWIASSFAQASKSKPMQYFGLGLYIVAEAIIFVPLLMIAQYYTVQSGGSNDIIFNAAMITLGGFFGLTGVAFVTRKDFSFLKGILMWGGIIALGLIVASLVLGFDLGIFFSFVMVALAGASILYTTSNIIHHYPEDSYVAASLELFAAFALMLWYVVRILISLAGDD